MSYSKSTGHHEDDCPYNYGHLCCCLGNPAPEKADKELDAVMTRYILQSDVRKGNEIVHRLDAKVKERLLAWREKHIGVALDTLRTELREYYKRYPDADYNDVSGYIVGFKNRPPKVSNVGDR